MKNKVTGIFAVVMAAGFLSGCAMVSSPVNGLLFTGVKGPVAISPQPAGSKSGRASASSILGIIATGDASIQKACQQGGITKIHHVDFEATSILGLFAKWTTVCYGE